MAIPKQFLSALSGDIDAVMRFSGLVDPEKDEVIAKARRTHNVHDIDDIINGL